MCSQNMCILVVMQMNAVCFTKLYARFSQIETEQSVVNHSEYFGDDPEKFC